MSRKPTGRPPGRPRRDGLPAGSVPKPVHVHEEGKEVSTGVTRDPVTGQLVCAYTEPQKAQAVAAYSVTNSAAQAVKVLEGLWGIGSPIPSARAIREWTREGVRADETALDAITRWYEARRKVLAFEVFERSQEALVARNLDNEKLFNVVGAYKIAGEAVAQAFQRPQGSSTTLDMRGATFIRSSDKPIPAWDHEVEAKEIE
jgi:hypothetical protein